ncbi:putative vacuolar protein sorting-associated protein [Helianthus anomalus]
MIREHVEDWEHITLRIDNVSGLLKEAYLSHYSKGQWLVQLEFELIGSRPVVPKLITGKSIFEFGLREDVASSSNVMDLALAMDIAYIDHSDALMEEPWLNYQGRWGPKSTYAFF